jgi:exonuclease SbcD
VLAHAFVAGAQPSESERDISVGGVSRVPTTVFEGVDYAALGHLHGRQVVTDRIRYSGSPLPYSFSEADHVKGTWLIDLDGQGGIVSRFVEAPVPRRLARIRGTLDALLVDRELDGLEDAWIQAVLTDDRRPSQAMERLRRRFPHALVLTFEPRLMQPDQGRARLVGRSDHEVTLDFVAHVRGTPADVAESALLLDACDGAPRDADADPVRA